jgi:hypothetical protein
MLMFIATFNNVSVFHHTCAVVRAFRRLMCYATFNIQSFTTPLLYSGGFKGLLFYATFNIVSVIYHTCGIAKGAQEAHVLCRFQYCVSYLPLLCCRHGGSGGSCLLPLSIMFQSSTTPLL